MKSFYRKIQDKLYAHQSPVETDQLWQAIQAELHPERKRRGFFWWLAGLVLLLSCAAGSWYLWSDESVELADHAAAPVVSPAKKTAVLAPAGSQQAPVSVPAPKAEIGVSVIAEPMKKSTLSQPFKTNDFAATKSSVSIIEDHSSSPITTISKNKKTAALTPASPVIPVLAASAIPSIDLSPERSGPVIPLRSKRLTRFALGIQTGLLRASRQFTADPEYQQLVNDRLATESALETIQLELNATYFHPSGLYLRGGLAYTRINERFDWQNTRFDKDTLPNALIQLEIGLNGDTLNKIYGPGLTTTTSIYENTTYNSVRLFDIPLILGYRLSRFPWHLGLETGIYFNLRQTAEGRILNSRGELSELDTRQVLKTRIGLGLHASIRLSYQLADQWEISVAPSLRYQPGNNSRPEYELKQRYHFFGLQASVNYLF